MCIKNLLWLINFLFLTVAFSSDPSGFDVHFPYGREFRTRISRESDSGWDPWGEWQCTATCGGGMGQRMRTCVDTSKPCRGWRRGYGKCNEQPCPSEKELAKKKEAKNGGGWDAWSEWECSATCGGGRGVRTRICLDPDRCPGSDKERGVCNGQACPKPAGNALPKDASRRVEDHLASLHLDFEVKKEEPVVLPCRSPALDEIVARYPESGTSWVQNGAVFQLDAERMQMDGPDLKISQVMPEDNGVYICRVSVAPGTFQPVSFATVTTENDQPDLKVSLKESFSLNCNGASLSGLFPAKFNYKWYHNSTLFKDPGSPDPYGSENLYVDSSNFEHSGIWTCKVTNAKTLKEWATNVIRVLVLPPESLQSYAKKIVLALLGCLLVGALIAFIYLKRIKKSPLPKADECEKLVKSPAKKKKKKPKKKKKDVSKKKIKPPPFLV